MRAVGGQGWGPQPARVGESAGEGPQAQKLGGGYRCGDWGKLSAIFSNQKQSHQLSVRTGRNEKRRSKGCGGQTGGRQASRSTEGLPGRGASAGRWAAQVRCGADRVGSARLWSCQPESSQGLEGVREGVIGMTNRDQGGVRKRKDGGGGWR